MNFEELKEQVGWGEEFSFYYQNEKYWISKNADGHYLTKVNGSKTQSFSTSEELLLHSKIDGKTLIEIWDDIKEQF